MRSEQPGGGVVEMLVLSAIGHGESYGYAITEHLTRLGVTDVGENTVYAALRRLEDRGLISSRREMTDQGRTRRYVSLTDQGHLHRKEAVAAWEARTTAIRQVLAATDQAGGS